jgi:Coenzyme F420-reducing hydrogenase, beta subunit
VAGELSKYCYENGYDVFGVVMDPEEDYCQFVLAASKEDLKRMKTSKYIQSDTGNIFLQMNRNHKTLVIGLPCQIYGIRKLIKQYGREEHFVLVDLFCRGVPSVHLWRKYREYLQRNYGLNKLVRCNFRSKQTGWHKFSMEAFDIAGKEYQKDVYHDLFYSFYLKNSCLKESCYSCEFRHNRVYSDIRLGDFWGSKYYSHEEGVSIVSIYTREGQEIWDQISKHFIMEENDPEELKLSQRFNRLPIPEERSNLLHDLTAELPLDEIHRKYGMDKTKFYNAKSKP